MLSFVYQDVWLCVTPREVQVCLWMSQCGKIRFFKVAKFTILSLLSLPVTVIKFKISDTDMICGGGRILSCTFMSWWNIILGLPNRVKAQSYAFEPYQV